MLVASCAAFDPGGSPSAVTSPISTAASAIPSPVIAVPSAIASTTLQPTPESSGEELAAGLPYFCGNGEIFDIDALSRPPADTTGPDPAAAIVPSIATEFDFDAGPWWSVYRSISTAEFLGLESTRTGYDFVVLKRKDGVWRLWNIGGCTPRYQGTGVAGVSWWIDSANAPKPEAMTLHLLARDLCPRTFQDRLAKPVVRYGISVILIIVSAEESAGACGDTQTAPVVVTLTEPIGDRMLVDGSIWPGRDPTAVPPKLSTQGG